MNKVWPKNWPEYHNANADACDMAVGPCACGATHQEDEFQFKDGMLIRYGEIAMGSRRSNGHETRKEEILSKFDRDAVYAYNLGKLEIACELFLGEWDSFIKSTTASYIPRPSSINQSYYNEREHQIRKAVEKLRDALDGAKRGIK